MGQCNSCDSYDEEGISYADATDTPQKALLENTDDAPRIKRMNGGGTRKKKSKRRPTLKRTGSPFVEPGLHTILLRSDPLHCTITKDERHILVSQRDSISIFKTRTGMLVRDLDIPNASKVAVSDDSSFFITPYSNSAFFICSFTRDSPPKKSGLPEGVHAVLKETSGVGKLFPANIAISNDGTLVLTSNDSFELRVWKLVWNVENGSLDSFELTFTSVLHIGRVLSIFISRDNSYAVTTARDCRTLIWSLESGTLLRSIAHEVPNDVMLVEEGRKRILVCWSELGVVRHIKVKTGEVLFQVKLDTSLHLDFIAVSPDYSYLINASFTHDIDVFDLQSGKRKSILEGHRAPILCYAVAPSCTFVITVGKDFRLFIWNVATATRWGEETNPANEKVEIDHHATAKWI